MKIIGGEFKTRRIEMPKGADIRPTSDKVREALFNVIKDRLMGASVLDLFAGSGSLGIEALSRGARTATFVDIQKRCIETIRKNIDSLQIGPIRVDIIHKGVLMAIKKLGDSKRRFDIIFMDPPYYGGWVKKCLPYLDNYDILCPNSLIICEHYKKDTAPDEVGRLKRVRQDRYGDTLLTYYINEARTYGAERT